MKLDSREIKTIAQELEAGMKVYINKGTLEFKSILDWDDIHDPEFWDEELEKIESEWTDYIVLTKMESHEAYQVMVSFIDEVDDPELKNDLIKILDRRSPFANFKVEVESSNQRQNWFDFRTKSYEAYIRDYLDLENIEHE